MVRKNYKLVSDADIAKRLRPGRHLCNCQARLHDLVRNCLSCGRVVCQQEGSGPCFYCGTLVCTREEREIIEKRDKKSLELLRELFVKPELQNFEILVESNQMCANKPFSLSSLAQNIENANAYKQKLLIADKDQKVTKVIDLQADYFSLELNPYLTSGEREAIVKRKEELRQLSLQTKRNILVNVDVSTGTISEEKKASRIESVDDQVLQSILVNSMARNLHHKRDLEEEDGKKKKKQENTEEEELIDTYNPIYEEETSRSEHKPAEVFANVLQEFNSKGLTLKNPSEEGQLYCIGLKQPLASNLAKAVISSIPWDAHVDFRGPVLIAAFDQQDTASSSSNSEVPPPPGFSAQERNYPEPERAILGRAMLRECLTWDEFTNEGHPDAKMFQTPKERRKGFVLIFENPEPFSVPIPYVCQSEFFKVDRRMIQTINSMLLSGGGIFDHFADIPVLVD